MYLLNKRKFVNLCAAAVLTIALSAGAFAKPNYSGNWKMSLDKSDLGPMPPPEKFERSITHEDPSLSWSQVQVGQQGEVKTEMKYTTDGKPSTNKTARGEVTGTAAWDGEVLTITTKREFQGGEMTQAERWNLSEDGKTLTINNKITAPQGEFDLKFVLEKQ
jgi:hypothetical protein